MKEEPLPDFKPPLRAVIVGCGRMGAGRDHKAPYVYTHIEAYRKFTDAVTVVGFADRVLARAEEAARRWDVDYFGDNVAGMLKDLKPDLVSICTPPSDRLEIIEACQEAPGIKGIWCEKPYTLSWTPEGPDGNQIPTQVNYIRRFDPRHQNIAERRARIRDEAKLVVVSALDIHTTCHFTDLAAFWNIKPRNIVYVPFHGPSLYILREPGASPSRYLGWIDEAFVGGGVEGGFMERALENLLHAIDGTDGLISPAGDVHMAEDTARAIIEDGESVWRRG